MLRKYSVCVCGGVIAFNKNISNNDFTLNSPILPLKYFVLLFWYLFPVIWFPSVSKLLFLLRCPLIFQSWPFHCPCGLLLIISTSMAALVTLRSTEGKVHPLLHSCKSVFLVSFQKAASSTKKLDGWAQMGTQFSFCAL